jgi:hypothetical protein
MVKAWRYEFLQSDSLPEDRDFDRLLEAGRKQEMSECGATYFAEMPFPYQESLHGEAKQPVGDRIRLSGSAGGRVREEMSWKNA